ncbi:peptidyl-prolyl cis-trans isomerase CYP28, chloroplastic [Argentina anserina]|uniref:peptidyl-prolyl cis-trans isomerase CYP28, chloroplastic n=1 Tax=Argentina anserina TaxID=57926 RepID=UPI0021765A9F|nr:peptidyl-prolyl cis-trans isomerase CYP28, chloroplastic [Potentilla anserina]
MGYSIITPPPTPSPHLHPNPKPKPNTISLTRRSLLLSSTALTLPSSAASPPPPDTTITDRVFLDFSLCPTYFRWSSEQPVLCPDPVPLGRIVLGLYGHLVPITVTNFKAMVTSAAYKGTTVHKLFPGQYFLAGHQGDKPGDVRRPIGLIARNTETVEPKAFELTHSRPGLLSLSLSENDDEDEIKFDPDYRNVEFSITTGPGPCPQLDYKNIVFGSVIEGLDVVTAIAAIPTYRPSERIQQFNDFATFLGDDRAMQARALWNKPLKTVYISDCGELKVAKPSFSPPSLP